ncbi:MAG: AarF/ABC1/UbiB kinase family protein [Ilumatobacteraceae bacterium]
MSQRSVRLQRTLRVWRLTARNGVRYATHRVRRLVARDEERRSELDDRFAIRSSEDVARELGEMKGALMKFGQLLSFIVEVLPEDAQRALASLQSDAPPMAPEAAAAVVRTELGAAPEKVFLDWSPEPVAAASVGQVHRAVTRDGRRVAVKVQYPGVGDAIESDLDNAEGLYRLFGAFALKGLDAKALVDELRARMREELDYTIEAANQAEFAVHFDGHPFVHIPDVNPATSTRRVLTTAWVDGITFDELARTADAAAKRRAGETIWRFAQHAVHHLGAFNGDPHPGNYRFDRHGNVTFLDFGLVKRWTHGEWAQLEPSLDAIVVHRDPERLVDAMETVGFLQPGHGLAPQAVYDYVSAPYVPYLSDEFTFTRTFVRDALTRVADLKGPHAAVIAKLNMPASFVILDRVVWGVERDPRQARGHRPLAGHAHGIPPRRPARQRPRHRRS